MTSRAVHRPIDANVAAYARRYALHALTIGLFAVGQLAGRPAHAQSDKSSGPGYYSCRDANGRMITSDQPIYECLSREQRLHNSDGSVRQVIAAPLTPEQKAARAEEARRKAEAEKAADEQRRRDRILLSSYTTVESLERARQRALSEPISSLERSRARTAELEKERRALEADKQFYAKDNKLPSTLTRKLEDNAFGLRYEADAQARYKDEMARVNLRYDADRDRLSQLLTAAPAK